MAAFLPEDLLFFEILTKLPVKSLMRFKCVSKQWMTRISGDRSFIDAHRRLQQPSAFVSYDGYECSIEQEDSDDLPLSSQTVKVFSQQFSAVTELDLSDLVQQHGRVQFTSSCKGLLCVTLRNFPTRVVLWNPATRQHRLLPSPPDRNRLWGVGIGLDEASGDWKVVHLCLVTDDPSVESLVRAHVLTEGSAAWRDCGVSGVEATFLYGGVVPVAAAGELHWNVFSGHCNERSGFLSFDLSEEMFRISNAPVDEFFTLCSWRSSLAALTYSGKSAVLIVASRCGEGLSWSRVMEFEVEVEHVWREHYLWYEMGTSFTLFVAAADPEAPGEVTNLERHIHSNIPAIEIYDYAESIVSVF